MHQGVSLEQTVHLQLTPELRTGIAVMAMTADELHDFLENQMDENPLLRYVEEDAVRSTFGEGEDSHGHDCLREAAWQESMEESAYQLGVDGFAADAGWPSYCEAPQVGDALDRLQDTTLVLEEELMGQLNLELRSGSERQAMLAIIGSLDDEGFFRGDLARISRASGLSPHCLERVRRFMVTRCDPVGIGALSLGERLKAQLAAGSQLTPLAARVIDGHLESLASGRFGRIAASLGVTSAEIKEVFDLIRTVDPHPAHRFARNAPMVRPELSIVWRDGVWQAVTDESKMPRLQVDQRLLEHLKGQEPSVRKMLLSMAESAQVVVRAVDLRRATLLDLASYVANQEQGFFTVGVGELRPLTMASAAAAIGVSEATVSRVANGTYVATPRGVLELRWFFHSGVVDTSDEDVSSRAVKQMMQELVAGEDPRHPLSDAALEEALAARGVVVSRRTVNKYRMALNIPSSAKRKEYG